MKKLSSEMQSKNNIIAQNIARALDSSINDIKTEILFLQME